MQSQNQKTKQENIHISEKALVILVSAHLLFLPWFFGSMHLPAQLISLALSIAAVAVALMPKKQQYKEWDSVGTEKTPQGKLIRFPVFWLGLVLFLYITTQAFNPSWRYQTDGKVFWMVGVESVAWIPQGVSVPFEKWGPWRLLIVLISAWLTVIAIWIGVTKRRSLEAVMVSVVVNGLLVAYLGIAQRVTKTNEIYWIFDFFKAHTFSCFVYKNHGGAYLYIILVLTCGLTISTFMRSIRRSEKSHAGYLLMVIVAVISLGVVVSLARGATLFSLLYLAFWLIASLVFYSRLPREPGQMKVAIAMLIIITPPVGLAVSKIDTAEAWGRLRGGLTGKDLSLESRQWASAATWKMAKDHPFFGVGAGGFEYVFPLYQHQDQRLVRWPNGQPQFWQQAHNDVLQIPSELGLAGCSILLATLSWWLSSLFKARFWINPMGLCIASGLVLFIPYAWFDFPFQCPAILITWSALWPVALTWTRLENCKHIKEPVSRLAFGEFSNSP